MNQEIEIEFKNLLSETEFKRLMSVFSLTDQDFTLQENHYFDTPNFDLKNHNSALRIRKKKGTYTLTLKQPHETGKLETHQTLTEHEANQLLDGKGFISGDVENIIKNLGITTSSIQFLGTLKTSRVEINYNGGILVLDHSNYLHVEDFELEYEVTDEQTGKQTFLQFLKEHQIPLRETKNKIQRFFDEKVRQQ